MQSRTIAGWRLSKNEIVLVSILKNRLRRFATRTRSLFLRFLIAFAAGFVSLVVQTTSLRVAIQEIGGNRSTSAAILATALLGLAIGAIGFGKLADDRKFRGKLAPLLLGLVSIALVAYAYFARPLAASIATVFSGSNGDVGWSPLVFALLVSLPLHAIIGGIIPSLLVLQPQKETAGAAKVRSTLAWLYAFETAGAAVGAIVAVFLMIPVLGIHLTLLSCGAAGCVISLVTFCFSLACDLPANEIEKTTENENQNESLQLSHASSVASKGLMWAVLLSSFASLGVELVWQRFFVFLLGSDSRSYAVVVAVTLIGISLGSWLSGLKWIRSSTTFAYGLSLLAISASFAVSLILLRQGMQVEVIQASLGWLLLSPFLARLLLAMVVIILPATCIGFAFPLVSDLWVQQNHQVGARVGRLYAVVAVGNVVGVFCCAAFLIPNFGLYRSAIILTSLPLAAAILLTVMNWQTPRADRIKCFVVPSVSGALCCGLLLTVAIDRPIRAGLIQDAQWKEVFYLEDGVQTVAVIESNSNSNQRRLMIDGVTVGESNSGVDEKQRLLAHLPFLIKANRPNQNVYTIGLGTGILASELAWNRDVDSVVATELSTGVIAAVDFFADSNRDLSSNAKVQIVNDDGIRFLRKSNSKFDVIISDGKSRPGAASNIAFFSREYYQLCANRLADDGVFIQWVSIRCDRKELATILKTFAGSFPYGRVGFASPGSIYLVGSTDELQFDSPSMTSYLQRENAASLQPYGWAAADDILSMYWLEQRALTSVLGDDVPLNTFDRPVLELFAWDSFRYSVQGLPPQVSLLQELVAGDSESAVDADSLTTARQAAAEILAANQLTLAMETDWLDRSASHWKQALTYLPELNRQREIADIYRELATQNAELNETAIEFSALLNVIELNCGTAEDRLRVAQILEQHGAYADALPHHYAAVKQAEQKAVFRVAFAECLMMLQKYRRADQQLSSVLDDVSTESRVLQRAKLLRDISSYKSGGSDPADPDLLSRIRRGAILSPESAAILRKFQVQLFGWER